MHGANRLGGNSLSDLLVFGAFAGEHAAKNAKAMSAPLEIDNQIITKLVTNCLVPFDESRKENPYKIHQELQLLMETHVGMIREESLLKEGIKKLDELEAKISTVGCNGDRTYNPGWHMCLDLHNMIKACKIAAHAALQRKESRGGHTRSDYPNTDKSLTNLLYVIRRGSDGNLTVSEERYPDVPKYLQDILDGKYPDIAHIAEDH